MENSKPQTAEDLDTMVQERRALVSLGQLAADFVDTLPEGNRVREDLERLAKLREDDAPRAVTPHQADRLAEVLFTIEAVVEDFDSMSPWRLALERLARTLRKTIVRHTDDAEDEAVA